MDFESAMQTFAEAWAAAANSAEKSNDSDMDSAASASASASASDGVTVLKPAAGDLVDEKDGSGPQPPPLLQLQGQQPRQTSPPSAAGVDCRTSPDEFLNNNILNNKTASGQPSKVDANGSLKLHRPFEAGGSTGLQHSKTSTRYLPDDLRAEAGDKVALFISCTLLQDSKNDRPQETSSSSSITQQPGNKDTSRDSGEGENKSAAKEPADGSEDESSATPAGPAAPPAPQPPPPPLHVLLELPAAEPFANLLELALLKLGFAHEDALDAQGELVLSNWCPLKLSTVSEAGSGKTIGDILGQIRIIPTIEAKIRYQKTSAEDVRERVMTLLLEQYYKDLRNRSFQMPEGEGISSNSSLEYKASSMKLNGERTTTTTPVTDSAASPSTSPSASVALSLLGASSALRHNRDESMIPHSCCNYARHEEERALRGGAAAAAVPDPPASEMGDVQVKNIGALTGSGKPAASSSSSSFLLGHPGRASFFSLGLQQKASSFAVQPDGSSMSPAKPRMRICFDPETEIPRLQKWFAQNNHPTRQQVEEYVRELNSLESRAGRKPLDVNNVIYWFKNTRAAVKRQQMKTKQLQDTLSAAAAAAAALRQPHQAFPSMVSKFSSSPNTREILPATSTASPFSPWSSGARLGGNEQATLRSGMSMGHLGLFDQDKVKSQPDSSPDITREETDDIPRDQDNNEDSILDEELEKSSNENYPQQQGRQKGSPPGLSPSPMALSMPTMTSGTPTLASQTSPLLSSAAAAVPPSLFYSNPVAAATALSQGVIYMSQYMNPFLQSASNMSPGSSPLTSPSSPASSGSFPNPFGGLGLVSQGSSVGAGHLGLDADKRIKRNRTFIDPVSEVPRLEEWFLHNTHPSHAMIARYTNELNSLPYRQKFPRLEQKNIQFWFKNRRAKCKRMNSGLAPEPYKGLVTQPLKSSHDESWKGAEDDADEDVSKKEQQQQHPFPRMKELMDGVTK